MVHAFGAHGHEHALMVAGRASVLPSVAEVQWPTGIGRSGPIPDPCVAAHVWIGHSLKISAYRLLISSALFSTPSGSSLISLISDSLRMPGLSTVWRWAEYWQASSTISCCASRECIQFWNRRAAFGLGAALNTALGLAASGVPSSGYTISTGWPSSL